MVEALSFLEIWKKKLQIKVLLVSFDMNDFATNIVYAFGHLGVDFDVRVFPIQYTTSNSFGLGRKEVASNRIIRKKFI